MSSSGGTYSAMPPRYARAAGSVADRSRTAAPGGGPPSRRGRPSTSRVGPSATMRPPSRMTARPHSCRAYGRSWVTRIVVTSRPSTISASSRRATRVEVRRRLVEHEDVGPHRQHRGQRDPPALAEAEVVRRAIGGVGHADGVERLGRAGVQLGAAQPEVRRPERDVVADGRHEQLVVGILEHDADAPADLGQVGLLDGQAADGDACPGVAALIPLSASTSVVLPAPFGPEHGDPLAARRRRGRRRRGRRGRPGSANARSRTSSTVTAAPATRHAPTRRPPRAGHSRHTTHARRRRRALRTGIVPA